MRMSLCCCGTLDGCSGCRVPSSVDISNATLSWSDPFVHGISGGTGTGTVVVGGGGCVPGGRTINWYQTQYVRPESNLESSIRVRKRTGTETGIGYKPSMAAGKELCQWLWNDPLYHRYVYHDYRYQIYPLVSDPPPVYTNYPLVLTLVESYVPTNATDATSPWNRVIKSSAEGTICGDCLYTPPPSCAAENKWKCFQEPSYTTGLLYLAAGYTPYTELSTYDCVANDYLLYKSKAAIGTFTWFWVFDLLTTVSRVQYTDDLNQFCIPGGVVGSPFQFGTIGGWDNTSTFGYQGISISMTYAKPLVCSEDLMGEPFVLTPNLPYADCRDVGVAFSSYPSEISVEFDAHA